jgi:hypothetical protein
LAYLFFAERWEEYHPLSHSPANYSPLVPFRFLSVWEVFSQVSWSLEGCLQRVAPTKAHWDESFLEFKDSRAREHHLSVPAPHRERLIGPGGYTPGRMTLAPEGLLQVCILWSPPFREAPPDMIRDVRLPATHCPKDDRCRDRPLLVETLADALMQYERIRGQRDRKTPPDDVLELSSLQASLNVIRRELDVVLACADPRHCRKLQAAFELIVGELTTTRAARRVGRESRSRALLAQRLYMTMKAAFQHYGPERYPNDAIYHVMATILNPLGITNRRGGEITAAAIQRDLHPQRYKNPA